MCSINKYLTEKMIDYHIIEPENIEIYTYGLTNGFIIIAHNNVIIFYSTEII